MVSSPGQAAMTASAPRPEDLDRGGRFRIEDDGNAAERIVDYLSSHKLL